MNAFEKRELLIDEIKEGFFVYSHNYSQGYNCFETEDEAKEFFVDAILDEIDPTSDAEDIHEIKFGDEAFKVAQEVSYRTNVYTSYIGSGADFLRYADSEEDMIIAYLLIDYKL